MKIRIYCLIVLAALLITSVGNLSAQDIKGGVVKYKQTTRYNFEKVFNPNGNARPGVKEWITTLPKSKTSAKVLYFTENIALYETDESVKEEPPDQSPRGLQRAIMGMKARQAPTVEIEIVYYDFGKKETLQQVMFMTRNWLVSDKIEKTSWKMTNRMSKVLKYNCMSAEMKKGENTITVWFTPEIPVSAGPDEFFGFPGMVLAVEINGEFTHVATSVELNMPDESALVKPDKGKKMDRKEFEKTVEKGIKEWKKNRGRRRR
ncbi:MAG: GLPGLI family protein [bacterium]|nr:GLPGLI family protein [bacterium]